MVSKSSPAGEQIASEFFIYDRLTGLERKNIYRHIYIINVYTYTHIYPAITDS